MLIANTLGEQADRLFAPDPGQLAAASAWLGALARAGAYLRAMAGRG